MGFVVCFVVDIDGDSYHIVVKTIQTVNIATTGNSAFFGDYQLMQIQMVLFQIGLGSVIWTWNDNSTSDFSKFYTR